MKINFDRELVAQCQTNAPRYTSYPTADRFHMKFTALDQQQQIRHVFNNDFATPISLYIHIPFCNTLCLFCACNKIITNNRKEITQYLLYLKQEFELYYQLIQKKIAVTQLHFGGGSPSWLSIEEINQLMDLIRQYFILDDAKEIAMEIDPRHTTVEFIQALYKQSFNRISIGLQDTNPKVQKAVNRVQSLEHSKLILDSARELGFASTNVDLIYGLPFQTLNTFSQTIDDVIKMHPERIALFNYAHLPNIFMPQTRVKDEDLPSGNEKLDILQMSVEKLANAGYVFIGMDHFAIPSDSLAISLNDGTLQRNFQGYSTHADTHMLSFGVSSIGFIGNSYYQNTKDITSYYNLLDNKQLPILRGFILSDDDILRRHIIQCIMCKFALSYKAIEDKFKLDFSQYFAAELPKLEELNKLGLIELSPNSFKVTDKGRFLIRNVALVFDKYLQQTKNNTSYSKSI